MRGIFNHITNYKSEFVKEEYTMNLPKDPVMLLSVINTQLRDHYPTLTELAAAYMTDADAITETLAAINYHYDEGQNQFI